MPADRRRSVVATALFLALAGLLGCSSPSESSGGASTSSEPVRVEVTLENGTASPSGDTVAVRRGQPVELVVTSDEADEIHVHADPEHEFEVPAGSSGKAFRLTLDTPGTYEVESHGLEAVIVRLQVR